MLGCIFREYSRSFYNPSSHLPGSLRSCKVIAGNFKYGWIAIYIICIGCKDFLSTNYRCSMKTVSSECIQTESRSIVTIDIDIILPICVFKEIKTPVQCSTPVVIRVITPLKPFPSPAWGNNPFVTVRWRLRLCATHNSTTVPYENFRWNTFCKCSWILP